MSGLPLCAAALACLLSQPTPARAEGGDASYLLLDEPVSGEYTLVCPPPADGQHELRLAFDVVGPDEMSYLRCANGQLALFRVAGSAPQRIGKPHPAAVAAGAEIALQRRTGRVRVIAGGRVLLDVPWDGPIGGKVGVDEQSGLALDALLVQPVDEPFLTDDFTREETEMAEWTTAGGTFRNTVIQAVGADPARSANPFSLQVATPADALATAGHWFWDSYRVSVNVRPLTSEMVGVCAYALDERNHLALRWRQGDDRAPAARQLVVVRDGREQVLAEGPGGFVPGEWYRLELRVTPGRVEALIDRDPALTAATDAFGQGGAGLWVRQGTAVFDDAFITSLDAPETEPPKINPVFVEDDIMAAQQVYLPRGLWRPSATDSEYWHWGRFYADASITLPLEQLQGRDLTLVIRPALAAEGVETCLHLAGVIGRLSLWAEHNGQPRESANEPLPTDDPVTVDLRGDALIARQADRQLLTLALPPAAEGREFGLRNAASDAIDKIEITSDGFRDYTFSSAPTDWFQGKGLWGVTSRWHCEPGWTFLGGTGDPNPVTWTKHAYQGDIVLEYFGAIRMEEDIVGSPYAYIHPGDINATLCGDGSTLGTGYSFVLAGWSNSKTAILRNGQVVAERSDVVIADPTTRSDFHRHWFRVRAEKSGDLVRYWVDGDPVLEYRDPDPLDGGRVGLWTFQNDLMVARARLWFANEEQPGSVLRVPTLSAAPPPGAKRSADATEVFDDFETGVGEWTVPADAPGALLELDERAAAAGRRSLRVTNADEGGPFTVYPVTTPFRAGEWSELSFDYRLDPDVRLTLYLYTNGAWHAVELTNRDPQGNDVVAIGSADLLADGKWHRATIDLGAMLRAKYPALKLFQVSRMALCPPWYSYVRCGMGGNRRGCRYWIDNFRVGPPQGSG